MPTTIHIDPNNGHDANAGLSPDYSGGYAAGPLKTFEEACRRAKVYLKHEPVTVDGGGGKFDADALDEVSGLNGGPFDLTIKGCEFRPAATEPAGYASTYRQTLLQGLGWGRAGESILTGAPAIKFVPGQRVVIRRRWEEHQWLAGVATFRDGLIHLPSLDARLKSDFRFSFKQGEFPDVLVFEPEQLDVATAAGVRLLLKHTFFQSCTFERMGTVGQLLIYSGQSAVPPATALGGVTVGFGSYRFSFLNCRFLRAPHYGLHIDNYCRNGSVRACEFEGCVGGVAVGEVYRNDANYTTTQINVSGNVVKNPWDLRSNTAGIIVTNARDVDIAHNIVESHHNGISAGWDWDHDPTGYHTADIRITGNDVLSLSPLSDFGAIYTLGRCKGGLIEDNHGVARRMETSGNRTYGCRGLYFDQGSSEWRYGGNRMEAEDHPYFFHWKSSAERCFAAAPNYCPALKPFIQAQDK